MKVDTQRVLNALTRLNEPHTRQGAWDDLSGLVPALDAFSAPGFLSCLHSTNAQFTVACRAGALRLYGVVAERQPHLLRPSAARIVDAIVARARDKDGGRELREACAEALGMVVANEPGALAPALRGVLPLLHEPSELTQLAGLACVVGVLTHGKVRCDVSVMVFVCRCSFHRVSWMGFIGWGYFGGVSWIV